MVFAWSLHLTCLYRCINYKGVKTIHLPNRYQSFSVCEETSMMISFSIWRAWEVATEWIKESEHVCYVQTARMFNNFSLSPTFYFKIPTCWLCGSIITWYASGVVQVMIERHQSVIFCLLCPGYLYITEGLITAQRATQVPHWGPDG